MPTRGDKQLQAKLDRLKRALSNTAPKRVGAAAERFFKESFRRQGWLDGGLRKWPATKGGKPGRVLKRTGLLMNSIRVARADWRSIQVVAGGPHVPYARIHNEGGTIQRQVTRRAHQRRAHAMRTRRGRVMVAATTVRRHQARMNVHIRKRQYMGRSTSLDLELRKVILETVAAAIR